MDLTMDSIPRKSGNIVFRKIEDEYILVPMISSSEDTDAVFNLNELGAAIWDKVDGKNRLQDIIRELGEEYDSEPGQLQTDVLAFVRDLIKDKLIEVS
ncbi:MAG: PqqD family protein [Nitrospirae bacterium]|nr:PqqD family protein [Nitrospirota bacterium]